MIFGILLAIYLELNNNTWTYSLFGSAILLAFLLFLSKTRPSLRKELFFGFTFYCAIFLLGVNLVMYKTAKNSPNHYQKHNNHTESYIIEIVDLPKDKPNSIQIIAEVLSSIDSSKQAVSTSGNVLLYFEKSPQSEQLLQGDKLIIRSNLLDIDAPVNPGQFNYKQYLSFNQNF